MLKHYWAYEFTCASSIEGILDEFNRSGPWSWQMRDSAWYGDYLNVRPAEGVRVRIHEFQEGGRTYTALLQIESESPAERPQIDEVCKGLLAKISAQNIKEIEPYD